MVLWCLFLLVAPCLALYHNREPPPPTPVSRQTPIERWLPVRLNQFMASDTRTFAMRFFYNDEFPGPNIVIEAGGEWKISAGWTLGGMPYEIAKQLKAGLFYTEHRYYGLSRPFENTEVLNLRFLTVDQALADLAQFIKYIKSDAFERGRYKSGKVVLAGCSYGGTMVTFMKVAYPHLVDAAYADSGPLQAQEDFPEFYEVVAKVIREWAGETCLSSIKEAMKQLVDLMATADGPKQISEMFKTCTTIQADSPVDVNYFYLHLPTKFASHVMSSNVENILDACTVLNSANVSSPVQRLANWFTSQEEAEPCLKISYTEVLADLRNTSYDSKCLHWRLWKYQTCVEFGWYQSTTSSNQLFLFNISEFEKQLCKDIYSVDFNEKRLRHGIQRTNIMFGGLRYRPDHLISVSGSFDPWYPVSPNATHGHHKSPVNIVPRATHCSVFGADSADDSEEMKAARKAVLNFMYENLVSPIPMASAKNIGATLSPHRSLYLLLWICFKIIEIQLK